MKSGFFINEMNMVMKSGFFMDELNWRERAGGAPSNDANLARNG